MRWRIGVGLLATAMGCRPSARTNAAGEAGANAPPMILVPDISPPPEVPYRQWVLSFDSSLAVRLGYDADALGLVCRSFGHHVMRRIRGRIKRQHGLVSVEPLHPGIVTVVQRRLFALRACASNWSPSPDCSSS